MKIDRWFEYKRRVQREQHFVANFESYLTNEMTCSIMNT